MNNKTNNSLKEVTQQDGIIQLNQITNDLNRLKMDNNRDFILTNSLTNIIGQVENVWDILTFEPRLPLFQLENEIKLLYKKDSEMQGAIVQFLFTEKFREGEEIDRSKIGFMSYYI
ncbi:hypothetical protein OO010_03490 [Flavobacteriaceae bacterium KMM 6898]|nr:hypothetical protein [Flavobacteriaceae bacterium KMM 6898]